MEPVELSLRGAIGDLMVLLRSMSLGKDDTRSDFPRHGFSAGQGMHYSGSKNQMQDPASADTIPYTLSFSKDGNSNAGPGAPRTLTINGQVLGTDYTAKTAGSYSDTVTVTLTN
jgi:hypothetical protein